ncbi:SAG-related sequence protein SRS48E, partial [Toxoplasma gondii COUG]
CLSGGVMATEDTSDVVMCSTDKKNQTVVSVALKNVDDSIKFACPKDSIVFPPITDESQQFCMDSWCSAQATVGDAVRIELSEKPEEEKDEKNGPNLKELNVYTVTMKKQNLKSSTLYFQCRPGNPPSEARVDTPGGKFDKDTTKCVIQVAAYGSKPAAAEAAESESCDTIPG